MKQMTDFLDLRLLESIPPQTSPMPLTVAGGGYPNSPHTLFENSLNYSIVMNLLGVEHKDIGIRVDKSTREISVRARKQSTYAKRGFFWIFGVPSPGVFDRITTRFKGGVLEITIPKFPDGFAA